MIQPPEDSPLLQDKMIDVAYGHWWLYEIGTCRIMESGLLPIPPKYKNVEIKDWGK
jgi:hypothetical protein